MQIPFTLTSIVLDSVIASRATIRLRNSSLIKTLFRICKDVLPIIFTDYQTLIIILTVGLWIHGGAYQSIAHSKLEEQK